MPKTLLDICKGSSISATLSCFPLFHQNCFPSTFFHSHSTHRETIHSIKDVHHPVEQTLPRLHRVQGLELPRSSPIFLDPGILDTNLSYEDSLHLTNHFPLSIRWFRWWYQRNYRNPDDFCRHPSHSSPVLCRAPYLPNIIYIAFCDNVEENQTR